MKLMSLTNYLGGTLMNKYANLRMKLNTEYTMFL